MARSGGLTFGGHLADIGGGIGKGVGGLVGGTLGGVTGGNDGLFAAALAVGVYYYLSHYGGGVPSSASSSTPLPATHPIPRQTGTTG